MKAQNQTSKSPKNLVDQNLQKLLESPLFLKTFSLLRTTHFAAQGFILPLIDYASTKKLKVKPAGFINYLRGSFPYLEQLMKQDHQNIRDGLYPIEVLKPESAVKHGLRYLKILKDSWNLARRREGHLTKKFNDEVKPDLSKYPE